MLLTNQYREILIQHFEMKKSRNQRYSLRAFARDLEVPVSRLSDVLNAKKIPSLPMAFHMASKLDLSNLKKDLFITSVQFEKEKILSQKMRLEKKLEILSYKLKNRWTFEYFPQISSWLDIAILCALNLKSGPQTIQDLSDFFNVTEFEVEKSFQVLMEAKEIIKRGNDWVLNDSEAREISQVSPQVLKILHASLLSKAQKSISEHSTEFQDLTSLMLSFRLSDLPFIRKKISEIADQLVMDIPQAKEGNTVYSLTVTLVPISKVCQN